MITKKKSRKELQLLSQEALDAYMNRPDFRYDANGDALYRHYKDRYTELGKRAMQDTMGQATALTGGYGSSYTQNVGQQAYQSYLSKADDVIPTLYQLAYDRYRDKGDRLYKTYQSWSQLEQQAAQQEQWEREYELEERKRQDANREFQLEQERKNSQTQTSQTQTAAYQPDYWASLAAYHKLGQNNSTAAIDTTAAEPAYDNGKVSEGNIKTMQRVLGLQETGKWTDEDRAGAGGLTADDAWKDYQQGKLQNRKAIGLGDQGLANGNVKAMERMLGLKEDGYWSEEDKQAAGGLSEAVAWEAYQRGLLQKHTLQVKSKAPSYGDIKSMERVLGLTEDGVWSEEDKKAAGGWSQDTAWEAYQRGLLQKYIPRGVVSSDRTGKNTVSVQESQTDIKAATSVQSVPHEPGQSEFQNNYDYYLSSQKQIELYLEKLNREISLMENEYAIYEDLATREIGKAEEPKLAQFRQQYSSIYEMRDAIEEKKRQADDLRSQAKWAAQEAEWLKKYSSMTYDELQTVIANLNGGEEKDWVADYAINRMSVKETQQVLAKVNWEYERLSALLKQYKMLTRFEQPAEGRAKIEQIAAVYGSVTDLEDKVTALRDQMYYLGNALRFNHLSENEDFAEFSKAQESGSWMYKMVNDPSTAGKFDIAASTGKYVDPLVGTVSLAYDAFNFDNLQHMNDDERAIFNYIYAKEGEKAAREYLDYLEYTLNKRSMDQAMAWVSARTQDIPFLSQTVASQLSTPIALLGGTGLVDVAGQKLRNTITGDYKPIDYNRDAMIFSKTSGTIRGTVAQDIADATGVIHLDEEKHPTLSRLLNGKSLADVYQFGMGVQDSAAVIALSAINPVLGKVGSVLLSASSGTQAMLDAVERGATDDQALAIGMISGCIEMLFEEIELNSLLKTDSKHLKEICDKALNGAVGGSVTEFTNLAADYLIMARNSGYERNIRHYLEVNPDWSYEQAEKQALIDSALQIIGAGIGGTIESLVLPSKKDDRKN